jgi:hypothetical protein
MNTVIYYPYVSPTPEWLKVAALCWDKIYRFVPYVPDVPEQYWSEEFENPEVFLLDLHLGVLESVNIRKVGFSVQDQFWNWIDAREEALKNLEWTSKWSIEEQALCGLFHSTVPGGEFVDKLKRRGLARIEYEPSQNRMWVQQRLNYYDPWILNQQGQAFHIGELHKTSEPALPVIYLPQDVARHYLSLCASQVAKEEKRDLVADGEKFTDIIFS